MMKEEEEGGADPHHSSSQNQNPNHSMQRKGVSPEDENTNSHQGVSKQGPN